ncbi:MAG: SGNH/GDSL hydrolase family protein [Bdellovibrio sp.]|nr:SGNH/GDSL hydrolase family protein [Bdellovibrio sp.]
MVGGVCIVLLLFCSSSSYAQNKVLMGVLGDSISAATFANTSVSTAKALSLFVSPYEPMFDPSIFLYENKETYSWATGNKIQSHYLYLKDYLEKHEQAELAFINVAIPGAEIYQLKRQTEILLSRLKYENYDYLKYVTLMIGANTACSVEKVRELPLEDIVRDLKENFKLLAQVNQYERIKILVSSIPKIPELGRKSIMDTKTWSGFTCHLFRDQILHSCNELVLWKNKKEYLEKLKVVRTLNELIQNVIKDAQQSFPSLDIYYSPQFFNTTVLPEDLAADCFHPNASAQEKISELLWQEQPWFH